MPQHPPHFSDALQAATCRTFVFLVKFLLTVKSSAFQDGGDLCKADDSELATPCSRVPQLSTSFSESFNSWLNFFFLAASQLKAKTLYAFQEDDQLLKVYTVVT